MSGAKPDAQAARAILDIDGRLLEADPQIAGLHERAGGRPGGTLAIPQVAALARLARRLNIVVSRGAIAADGDRDLDLWVRAEPHDDRIALTIGGWTARSAHPPVFAPLAEREADFSRAEADWAWETDAALNLTVLGEGASSAPAALIGKPLTGLFRFLEDDDGGLPILAALAQRQSFADQRAELRHDPRETYRLRGVPLIDGNGKFAGFRGFATSLSTALREVAANDLGEGAEFGARLDAALRTPIAHIVAHAETISGGGEGPLQPEYAGYAADIASAGRHLLSLVDDLADLQAIERPDFRPAAAAFDLAQVARQAMGLIGVQAAARSVRIVGPGEAEALSAVGEYRRVLQIVTNLIGNAARYSPDGGAVRVALARTPTAVSLSVADAGKGIDAADQVRIFEKFERVDPSEPGGTGLGLYIARRLARAMGGDLVVDSAPGRGAIFTLTLPGA